LQKSPGSSLAVQELTVLLASRRAVNEAQQVLAHLTGVEMSASA
jgi:hypothetical protein